MMSCMAPSVSMGFVNDHSQMDDDPVFRSSTSKVREEQISTYRESRRWVAHGYDVLVRLGALISMH